MKFTEWIRDKKTKEIMITCKDQDGTLEKLIEYIKSIGNTGHSFVIVVDPEEKSGNSFKGGKKFFWDGDGSDAIYEIESKIG